VSERVEGFRAREESAGLASFEPYAAFRARIEETKRTLLDFLIEARRAGQSVVGYGAPGKANTLLNYCGIRTDFVAYTVDRSPHKQGLYLPGSRILVRGPEEVERTRPDFLFILPWNLKDEVMAQMRAIRGWGGRFLVRAPELRVCE